MGFSFEIICRASLAVPQQVKVWLWRDLGLGAVGAEFIHVPPCLRALKPLPSDQPGSQSWLPHLPDWASSFPVFLSLFSPISLSFSLPLFSPLLSFSLFQPCSIWSSSARDEIQDTVATYAIEAATLKPLTHCAGLGNEPAQPWWRDAADPIAPQWELLRSLLEPQFPQG